MSDLSERLRTAFIMGDAFYEVKCDFVERGFTMMKFEDFKTYIKKVGGKCPPNLLVFEKEVCWQDQSIWCSSPWLMEEVRIVLLTKGIPVEDDTSDDKGEILLMKECTK